MELSSSNIKKYFLHFEKCNFPVQAQKEKKIHLPKNPLYFAKWNFIAVILKKLIIFPEMKHCRFQSQPSKFFIKKTHSEKISFVSSKEMLFLYIRKW